ncbi:MAG TPA: hypothetical protein VLJ10_03855, partial [Candidatus Bathyarchaeia archaeon]|nr:hypothetical protein [Candidatus Bathyarchaeia archaeon]
YEHTKVFNGNHYVGRVRDFDNASYAQIDEEKIKKKLIFRYMYLLTPQNRKVQSMLKLAQLLKENGIEAVFYITPVDFQTGLKYLGPDFFKRVSENTHLISSLLNEKSIQLLDLSFSLPSRHFTWHEDSDQLYPNEHLQFLGRMFVVKSLLERTVLEKYYSSRKIWQD